MPLREETDEHPLDQAVLADDHPLDLHHQALELRGVVRGRRGTVSSRHNFSLVGHRA
ncbi:hypothetical protein GCM10023201_06980 [Actinomycetospora corticicola]